MKTRSKTCESQTLTGPGGLPKVMFWGNSSILAGVLRRAGRPLTIVELQRAIGGDPADIMTTVHECVADGRVLCVGGDAWTLVA